MRTIKDMTPAGRFWTIVGLLLLAIVLNIIIAMVSCSEVGATYTNNKVSESWYL